MVDPLTVVGGVSAALGIAGFAYQLYQKRQAVREWKDKQAEAETRLEEIEEEKAALEDEKQDLKASKEEYEKIVDEVREIIGDLQDAVENGGVDKKEVAALLDRLEACVLPKDEQILSKLDRLLRQVRQGEASDAEENRKR